MIPASAVTGAAAPAIAGPTPPETNRGVHLTRESVGVPYLGIGWVQGTYRGDREVLLAVLAPIGSITGAPFSTKWYAEASDLGDDGSAIAWAPRGATPDRAQETFVQIKQRSLDRLGLVAAVKLLAALERIGFHFTRVDVWIDDRQRLAEPLEVWQAFRARQAVTHLRKGSHEDYGDDGATTYLGRKGVSEILVRVYDKDAERHAERGTHGIRWELQATGDRAAWVAAEVTHSEESARSEAIASLLAGVIDFRDRVGMANGTRAARLTWWAELIGAVGRAMHHPPQACDSLAKRVRWFTKQVLPTFAVLFEASGGDLDWFVSAATEGRKRWGLREHRLLRASLLT